MQAIHQSTNERLDEQEKEIQTNESHILELVEKVRSLTNQISVLMEANEHLTFVQILKLNLKYIYQIPVPVKLVLGGTVAYKVYGRYSKSNDSNTNSQPTFSLMPNTDPILKHYHQNQKVTKKWSRRARYRSSKSRFQIMESGYLSNINLFKICRTKNSGS